MRVRSFIVYCIAFALLFGIGASPVVADEVDALVWTQWMSSKRLAYDIIPLPPGNSWSYPHVSGDWAVWQITSNSSTNWNVVAQNLRTRLNTNVAVGSGNQTRPRAHGSWVVYEDTRNGNSEIYAFNLATKLETRLTTRAGEQILPDISGTRVVYADVAAGDVYLHDLATGAHSALPLGTGTQSDPRISGHRVVYLQDNEVYVYDLWTGLITRLTNDAVVDAHPDIDGTIVAWHRGAGSPDVWCQDLAGGAAFAAVSTADAEGYPSVSGSRIAYFRFTGTYAVGVYDVLAKKSAMVTDDDTDDVLPTIDGDSIIYVKGWDAGNQGGDVALGRLIAPVLTATGPSAPVRYGAVVGIAGSLVENGLPLGNTKIAIDRSTNGGETWSEVATATTDAMGDYSWATPRIYSAARYRIRYNGGLMFLSGALDHFSAHSKTVMVTPRASLGRPTGYPRAGTRNRSYSVYGSLRARQAASTTAAKVVVIKCYRYEQGRWRYKKSVNARVYNYSTYSRYRASVKLTSSGTWRMRAYFKGSSLNAPVHSSYRTVRVR